MSIGVFWQKIFCCSCPSAVEWPTSTHQTIPIGGHFYVYFMLSIMNRLGLTRSYVTCTFASVLVSKGQISIWHICLILKLALYKYHIIIHYYYLVSDYHDFVNLVPTCTADTRYWQNHTKSIPPQIYRPYFARYLAWINRVVFRLKYSISHFTRRVICFFFFRNIHISVFGVQQNNDKLNYEWRSACGLVTCQRW